MSSLKALFGSGGGSGVPIGMYAWGNASLPDIVVDGTASYIKTGVVASSVDYPLAPRIGIGFAQRYATGPSLPASGADTPSVLSNGLNILLFAGPDTANSTYRFSTDGGLTFVSAALPTAAMAVRDYTYAAGFYFILLQSQSSGAASIWRSATGAAGEWAQIYSFTAGTNGSTGIAYGAGQLALSYTDGTNTSFVRVSTNVTSALGSVTFGTPVQMTGWSAPNHWAKIRYGKLGYGSTPTADVWFVAISNAVFWTSTPTVAASWTYSQYDAGAFRPGIGTYASHQVVGEGTYWVMSSTSGVWMSNASIATAVSGAFSGVAQLGAGASYRGGYGIAVSSSAPGQVSVFNMATGVTITSPSGSVTPAVLAGALILPAGTVKAWFGPSTRISIPAGNYTDSPSRMVDDTVTRTDVNPYYGQNPVAFMRVS